MSEGRPKIIDFGKEKLAKRNAERETNIRVTDGNFIFPGEKIEITEKEALDIAYQVVKDFSSLPLQAEEMRKSLVSQQGYAAHQPTERLVQTLYYHKKSPEGHYIPLVFAVAEELIKRFPRR